MKFLKYAILSLALFSLNTAYAKAEFHYTAPIHNTYVGPASKIYVEYDFESHDKTLVCTVDNESQAITSVEWLYKKATRKLGLPVTLVDAVREEGHVADQSGTLIITNEFYSKQQGGGMEISCEYHKPT